MLISLQPAVMCKTIFPMRTPIQCAFLAENKSQMHKRFFSWLLVFSVVVLVGGLPLLGQTSATGAVAGTIADPSGALVGGAQVAAINTANGLRRSTLTDKQGVYRFSLLEPGDYDIEVQTQNFKGERKTGIVVSVGETYVVNFALQVGTRQEEVTVRGDTQLVQSESATVGGLVGRQTIEALPLSTRNYTQILDLSTGVQADVNNAGNLGLNTQDVFVNGARSIDNNFQMDGVEVNNAGTGRGGETLAYAGIPTPNPDAIQEFNVQTSLYDAGYGRGAGANVNVVTKSGGNHFHGNLFEFFRNNALDANDYFLNETGQPRSVLRQNQFGGTFGGPIVKDKLFFFISYQGTRQTNGVGTSSSSSALLPAALTNQRSAAALGQAFCGQTGFYGGTVACDGTNINPVALALLNYKFANGQYLIPAPQILQSGGLGLSAFSIPSTFSEDQYVGNADYMLSPKNTLSARVFIADDPQTASFSTNYLELPGSGAQTNARNRVGTLKLTSALTQRLVNEVHISFNRNYGREISLTPMTDAEIGMVQPGDVTTIPIIGVTGLFNLGGTYNDNFTTAVNSYQAGDQLSTTIGRHNLHFGVELERLQDNFDLNGIKRGSIQFQTFADFLLGESGAQNGSIYSNVYSSFANAGITDRHFRANNFASFAQDDFKVNSQLTVNLGVRWEVFGGLSEKDGRLVNFWPTDANNDFGSGSTYSGYVVADNFKGSPPAGVVRTGNNTGTQNAQPMGNVGPRVGLAWRPFVDNNRLVVRTGYGIYYSRTSGNNVLQLLLEPPYVISISNSGVGNVAATFQNPWGTGLPSASQFPIWIPRTSDGQASIENIEKNWKTPMTQQWNLNLQYEFAPNMLWEIGYVGSRGEHLVLFREPDQAGLASVSNPINGETTNTVENAYNRVPVLGFSPAGIWQVESEGNSFYNGLQTSVTKRLSHGVQFKAAYTFSRSLDDVPTSSPNLFTTSTGFTSIWGGLLTSDQNNRHTSWGLADFDRTHRFVFSYLWQLPKLHSGNAALRAVANGWQVNGVTTLQSGNPLAVYDLSSGSIYGLSYGRAQLKAGYTGSVATQGSTESRLNNWINSNAFGTPVPIGDGYGYGNSGRGIVRGPNQNSSDLSVMRDILLGEHSTLQFRVESFNLFNHPQFRDPNTILGPGFGTIAASSVMPRILQLAVKVNF
jgi:hypothetical protein